MSNQKEEAQPVACDHEWTDDGGFLLVCTKCEAQEDRDPKWRDMESAPTDGTLLRLLVNFDEHPTEDADEAPTIGANNFDNDGEDVWRFAGWCWSHDHFTQGVGTPVGWLPMIEVGASTAELYRVTAERDALQQRLNELDQRIDELTAQRAPVAFPGYPPVDPDRQQPIPEQFLEDHLGKRPDQLRDHTKMIAARNPAPDFSLIGIVHTPPIESDEP